MRQRLNSLLARLLIGWAVPLVLFGAVGLVAAVVITRLLGTLALEKHTHEVIIQALHGQHQLERIRDAVAADGDRRRVARSQAYTQARQEFARILAQLGDKVQDHEEQGGRVRDLQALLARLDGGLTGKGAPPDPAEADRLLTRMDAQVQAFIRAEEGLLQERRARTQQQTEQSLVVVGVAVGLALFLTVL